jgi:peptide/nickel transport system permease protein
MTILLRHVLPNIRGTLLTVIALAWTRCWKARC